MAQVSDVDFVAACQTCSSINQIAERLGLKVTTVTQRRSSMRKAGFPIPAFEKGKKGGSVKAPTPELLAKIAEMTGKSVDELVAQGEKAQAEHAQMSAKIKAAQSAVASLNETVE